MNDQKKTAEKKPQKKTNVWFLLTSFPVAL